MKKNYYELDSLKNIYLEDSYVLKISELPNDIKFLIETVLTEDHINYEKPQDNEQYCYKLGVLVFSGLHKTNWLKKNIIVSSDANEEIDLGNIDSFTFDDNIFCLKGDWGSLEIHCEEVGFKLISEED